MALSDKEFREEFKREEGDELLSGLFDKGLLNGGEKNGRMYYNLSKITHENEGAIDPGLLEP